MRSNRLFAIAAIARLAAAAAVSTFADRVVSPVCYGVGRLFSAWVEPLRALAKPPNQEKPRVALVAVKAFVLRIIQRRRPERNPGWLMCPST